MKFEFNIISIYVIIQQYMHLSSLTRLQLWMPTTTATFQHLVDENVINNLILTICLIDLIQGYYMCHVSNHSNQLESPLHPRQPCTANSRCIFPHPAPCPALLLVNSSLSGFLFSDSNFPFLQKNKYSFSALEGYFHYQDPHPCLLACPQYLLDCWFIGSQSRLCDMDLWTIVQLSKLMIFCIHIILQNCLILSLAFAGLSVLSRKPTFLGQCIGPYTAPSQDNGQGKEKTTAF